MKTEKFEIPISISKLIDNGFWPKDKAQASVQNKTPLIPSDSIKKLIPNENNLYLYSPDCFVLLKNEIDFDDSFWKIEGALSEIDPNSCLIIGDFGLGSDAPLILDYSDNKTTPSVKKLDWGKNSNHWIEIAKNMDEFLIGLDVNVT